jgi:hypothetical protein
VAKLEDEVYDEEGKSDSNKNLVNLEKYMKTGKSLL